jgi:hypothetical protein
MVQRKRGIGLRDSVCSKFIDSAELRGNRRNSDAELVRYGFSLTVCLYCQRAIYTHSGRRQPLHYCDNQRAAILPPSKSIADGTGKLQIARFALSYRCQFSLFKLVDSGGACGMVSVCTFQTCS